VFSGCVRRGAWRDRSHLFVVRRNRVFAQVRHNERYFERWGAGVETQKNVLGEVGGWGRVPFNEPYAPSLSTFYDGA